MKDGDISLIEMEQLAAQANAVITCHWKRPNYIQRRQILKLAMEQGWDTDQPSPVEG